MELMLYKLLEMTLYGSVAIILVMLFRALFRKVPKKITCLFWIAAAIRLLCPYNFSSDFGIMNVVEKKTPVKIVSAIRPAAYGAAEMPQETANGGEVVLNQVVEHSSFHLTAPMIALIVWAVGVVVIFAVFAYKAIKLQNCIKGGKSKGNIIESDLFDTPFVIGFVNPRIVIPSTMDPGEKDYLILHEKVHIKNKDHIIRALGLLIASIHWFNPLVWIAFALLCNDLEMRVDEEVIDKIGDGIKKDYCLSIVNHAMKSPRYKVYGASFAKKTLSGMEVKMRIKNLLKYKNVPTAVGVAVVIATLGMTTVLSSCAKEAEKKITANVTKANEEVVPEASFSLLSASDDQTGSDVDEDALITEFKRSEDNARYLLDRVDGHYEVESLSREGKVRISHDGDSYDLPVYRLEYERLIVRDCLFINMNGERYIYVSTAVQLLFKDDINIYKVTEDGITFEACVPNLLINQVNEEDLYCEVYTGLNGYCHIFQNYVIGEDGMPVPADDVYQIEKYREIYTKEQLTGYVVDNGEVTSEKVEIGRGKIVDPIASDFATYVDFRIDDRIVRVDYTDIFNAHRDEENDRWIIEAITSVLEY